MSNLITVVQTPSNNANVYEGDDITAGSLLAKFDIESEGKVVKFKSVEISLDTILNSDGVLTVTKGGKGNL